MQIEILIDGEKKIFNAPITPMLARRKYLEIQAAAEEREGKASTRELLAEEDEIYAILSSVVFKGQFTAEQLLEGTEKWYFDEKLNEAIWGRNPNKKVDEEGNEPGK